MSEGQVLKYRDEALTPIVYPVFREIYTGSGLAAPSSQQDGEKLYAIREVIGACGVYAGLRCFQSDVKNKLVGVVLGSAAANSINGVGWEVRNDASGSYWITSMQRLAVFPIAGELVAQQYVSQPRDDLPAWRKHETRKNTKEKLALDDILEHLGV